MLNVEMLNLLFIGGVVGMTLGASGVFTFLKRKDINVPEVLDTAEEVLDVTGPAIKLAEKIAPNNPIINTADFIEKWAKTGVKNAQQLYHTSQLTNNKERKESAKSTVYAALKELNIEPTENQKKLIEDTIEAAVNDLGHKEPLEAERQAEKQVLQEKVVLLTQERDSLKNTITQINNTASTACIVQK